MAWRGREVELRCGECETIFARVHVSAIYRVLHARRIDNDARVMPRPGYSINEESRQRLARAEQSDDQTQLDLERQVAAYLHHVAGEIVYDLRCPCGLRYVRSSPDLTKQILKTQGRWVTLAPGLATWRKA